MKKIIAIMACLLPVSLSAQDNTAAQQKSMDIYGHVMTDVIYNFGRIHPDWKDGLRPTKLPTAEGEYGPDGTIYFGVRQSRFGVKGYTPTKFGELKTQFEFELYGTGGDAGQTTFRLRHAYGELGKWGVGQTWSPFMDVDMFPNSLEYWGPCGMVFFRNIQVRYMPIQGESFMTIALERPGFSADGATYTDIESLGQVKGRNALPDLSAEYRKSMNWGYVEIAGIVRSIAWEDLNTDDGDDLTDSKMGYGVNLSSNIKFGDKATARLGFVYGSGIENYMNDATTDLAVKFQPDNADKPYTGEVLPMFGGSAFVDLQWNDRFSSTVGYSMIHIDNIDDQSYDTFQDGGYGLANLLYYPAENVMCGVEVQYASRNNKNGEEADLAPDSYLEDYSAVRVQFSFKYKFGTSLYRKAN